MNRKSTVLVFLLIAINVILSVWLLIRNSNIQLLNPQGIIALKERNVILIAISLMLLVIIPVVITTFFIAWKYRASNTKVQYSPEGDHKTIIELAWWVLPSVIILILSLLIWENAHALDPQKPLLSNAKPITIQVVALRWKWLFIYPDQHIATVNFIQFPSLTPVNFELTADAPMSSFWIPSLGGQMYAMTGMRTQLHLEAFAPGQFDGSAAEINGSGFAGMKFIAKASSQADFDKWVQSMQHASKILTLNAYKKLAEPSMYNPPESYSLGEKNLYNEILMQYMAQPTPMQSMNDMDMKGMNQ